MRTVLIANRKGGVGKTLIAVTLASALAGRGLRVALADADRHRVNICHDWFSDPECTRGADSAVLIAESRSLLHHRVGQLLLRAVIALEVLEHLFEPGPALRRLVTMTHGALVLTVPHEPWFQLANLARGRSYTFTFIVSAGETAFFNDVRSEIETAKAQASKERITVNLVAVPPLDPHAIVDHHEERCQECSYRRAGRHS